MISSSEILQRYISFFEKRGHKKIEGAPLVLSDDPTTLFTSSGMQPLVPNLLGKPHPGGNRLVNVQNCFRAVDIDEVGDNRHTTLFRMLGNWSLGDYFKKEQLEWFFEFLINKEEGLGLSPHKLFVTVFEGDATIPKDEESAQIWKKIWKQAGFNPEEKIFYYDAKKNWWSRAGVPENMPPGEPGGPDSEVFYDFGAHLRIHENSHFKDTKCHPNCDCGRFLEIGNSVFMQYVRKANGGFDELPKKNVDFGGGLERLIAAYDNKQDIFETSLFIPIISTIEQVSNKIYAQCTQQMRIVVDHFIAAAFLIANDVIPSNKEQGYILRRLIRRGFDNLNQLRNFENINLPIFRIVEAIISQYSETDINLKEKSEKIKNAILEEVNNYRFTLTESKRIIEKELGKTGVKVGDELMGVKEISADLAFKSATSLGLGPTQLKSLGYIFDDQKYAQLMKKHQEVSRKGMDKKFAGGLADHEVKTIHGHTATHLLHQALRDTLGNHVRQTGSNITTERVRFDFNFDRKLTAEEIHKIEKIVNSKIKESLPVHFEFMSLDEAKKLGAIGLFGEKYGEKVKIYFIGGGSKKGRSGAYSIEFCGGPHVSNTSEIKTFTIRKEETLGKNNRRIYAHVE